MNQINMKLISHRGNLEGSDKDFENNPICIERTINLGYDVELDIWKKDNNLYLGHDNPQYNISIDWLLNKSEKLWIHCKNEDALFYLKTFNELNIFFHTNDEFTISSKNKILINPFFNTKYTDGILMMPEVSSFSIDYILKFNGIITDKIKMYENNFNIVRK
jgi:hypothetical protein